MGEAAVPSGNKRQKLDLVILMQLECQKLEIVPTGARGNCMPATVNDNSMEVAH